MSIEDAKKSGAMALFGEKYDDNVRVVSMGNYSMELCGGTHVVNTSNISVFKIIAETSIAAGVRRIEALTGRNVFDYYNNIEKTLNEVASLAKTEPSKLSHRIEHLLEEVKSLNSENEKLKSKLATESIRDVFDQVIDVKGVKLIAAKVANVDMNGLRSLGDQLKDKLQDGVVVLTSSVDNKKVNLIVMASDSVVKKGANAGKIIKELSALIGGGGGGRPNMAQAGGKNPDGMDEVIRQAPIVLEKKLKIVDE